MDIAWTFQTYYTGLYNLTSQASQTWQEAKWGLIQQYLDSSAMPSLSKDIATDSDEFLAALNTMKPGKAYFDFTICVSV